MTRLLVLGFGVSLGVVIAYALLWKKEPEYDPFIEPWGDQ